MHYKKILATLSLAAILTACGSSDALADSDGADYRDADGNPITFIATVGQGYETTTAASNADESLDTFEVERAYEQIEVLPQCAPSMGISFSLPDGWSYTTVQTDDEPTSSINVYLKPDEEADGAIEIIYTEGGLGVCGTGLTQEPADFNGHSASKGFYDGKDIWSFISLDGDYRGCAILNNAEWYSEYEDTINVILSSVEFKFYDSVSE